MTDLAAICDRCHREVPDGAGYVCVRYEDIHRCWRETREWKEAHPGEVHDLGELMGMPEDITWRVYHARCDPWPDKDAYQIDVEQIIRKMESRQILGFADDEDPNILREYTE